MRLGVCVTFCLAMLLIGSAASPGARVQPVPHGAVAFWNAEHGLVGTGSAFCSGPCGHGTVQLTTNGGRTWKQVLKTDDAIVSLDVAGRAAGWAVAENCKTLVCHSKVWRTSNGGRTWSVVASGLTSVSFADARNGMAVRTTPQVSKVFRSTNGGRAWREVPTPCKAAANQATAISLVAARHAYVVCTGLPAGNAENKSVYETTDGGATWTRKVRAEMGSGVVTSLPVSGYVAAADFSPSGFGAICQIGGVFLVSRNGGRTWLPAKLIRPSLDTCGAVAAAPGGATFAIITTRFRDRLVVTTNAGRKWHVVKRF